MSCLVELAGGQGDGSLALVGRTCELRGRIIEKVCRLGNPRGCDPRETLYQLTVVLLRGVASEGGCVLEEKLRSSLRTMEDEGIA